MSKLSFYDRAAEATDYVSQHISQLPRAAVVLGSGLGTFADKITDKTKIPYSDIPHFPPATVKGHEGALILGRVGDHWVIAQSGRYHYYEGYDMKEVTLPIRVFHMLGIQTLLIASAVGGIHEDYEAGDVTVVNDHINLHSENPLRGVNDERWGPRFPDMVDAYAPSLIRLAHQIASEQGVKLHNSVYAGLSGPNIETKAEYEYLHRIGGTVVGMSTVPEIIVAQHMGMASCVLTAVTNKCYPISAIRQVTHDSVIQVAQMAEAKISPLVLEMIQRL